MQTIIKNLISGIWKLASKYWTFILAFSIMAIYLSGIETMYAVSGDAGDIWKTISTFYSKEVLSSYVLYKGFLSVYPYVWLYELSMFFGINQFFFIKIFHCVLFAYITSIGLPHIIEHILNIKIKKWRIAIFTLIMFWLWEPNAALSDLMVDLPGLFYFISLVSFSIVISENKRKQKLINLIITGILLGFNFGLSGQYTPAAIIIILYITIKILPFRKPESLKMKESKIKRWFYAIGYLGIIFLSLLVVICYENYFYRTITQVFIDQGNWVVDTKGMLNRTLIGGFGLIRRFAGPFLPDPRGYAILNSMFPGQGIEIMKAYGGENPVRLFLKILYYHPIDYSIRIFNSMLLIFSPDAGDLYFNRLFVSYTMLFFAPIAWRKSIHTVKDIFTTKTLLIFIFLSTQIVVFLSALEPRYAMQIQGLIFGFAVLDDTFWGIIKSTYNNILMCYKTKSIKPLLNKPISGRFLLYVFIMFFCLSHIASMYDSIIPNVGVENYDYVFK